MKLLEQHESFGREILNLMLTFLVDEVFFKQIDLIIFFDRFLDFRGKLFDCNCKRRVLLEAPTVLVLILLLKRVDTRGPLKDNC